MRVSSYVRFHLVKKRKITKRTHFRFWTSFYASRAYADSHSARTRKTNPFQPCHAGASAKADMSSRTPRKAETHRQSCLQSCFRRAKIGAFRVFSNQWRIGEKGNTNRIKIAVSKYQLPSPGSLIVCWAFPELPEKGNGLKFLRSCEGRGPQ